MAKIGGNVTRRAKVAGLDRFEAALEGIVQPRQLSLGHIVIRVCEDQIDLPLREPWGRIAGDVAVLDVNADRIHHPKVAR